ncbi:MAG: hypothetical protein LBS48_06990 [Treponema sp.]|jgi:hypothetical protein|nr:hypothetical protein [Treponema sp.]
MKVKDTAGLALLNNWARLCYSYDPRARIVGGLTPDPNPVTLRMLEENGKADTFPHYSSEIYVLNLNSDNMV